MAIAKMGRSSALLGAVIAAIGVSWPAESRACWDGYAASVGKATASHGPDATWSPDVARHAATWLARIDALLPAGVNVLVYPWGVSCEGPACAADWIDVQGGYSRAFEVTAQNVAAGAATVRRARRAAIEPVTVQVFAGSVRAARALAERINDDENMGDWRGFYDAGGFPANNPAAHVVRAVLPGGASVHRVLVGAYLGIADAEATRAAVAAATGARGFVRPLAGAGAPIEHRPSGRR